MLVTHNRWLMRALTAMLAASIIGIACHRSPKYVIEGTLPSGEYDGELMYLVPMKGKHPRKVDSVRISNGAFRFEGDSFVMKVLRSPIRHRMKLQELLVVTEPGHIRVDIDTVSSGGGTPQNDALQAWKEHLAEHNNAIVPLWHALRHGEQPDTAALKNKIDSLQSANALWNYQFLKTWQGTVLGQFVGEMAKHTLTSEQANELFGKNDEDNQREKQP